MVIFYKKLNMKLNSKNCVHFKNFMFSFTLANRYTLNHLPRLLLKIDFMEPTYSFSEVKSLIRSLDLSTLKVLQQLIEDEKTCYPSYELKALQKFISLQNKHLIQNEVKFEYLLSFN